MLVFSTVFVQVVVLFILIFLGVLFSKIKILNENAIKSMTDIVLYLVTPSVIIKSFLRKFERSTLNGILLSFLAAFIVHLVFILLTTIVFRDKEDSRKRVLRFAAVFGNCGFMSLPIQQAILSNDGVLYGASFIAVFNLFAWTYGITEMSGDKRNISVKRVLINPGVTSLIIGFIVFIFSIPMPRVLSLPVGYLAALNTPLPMIIIGYHLSKSNIKKAITDIKCFLCCACRLLFFPAAALSIVFACGFRGNLFVSCVISACSPVAAYTTIFAYKYGKDTDLSVNTVSLSTILSLISMPVLITLAKMIA
ncbi:MAG: AEC family transporter [Clostridia bacterium]|nr:AEC family transporter [Clostridia bacterium]